MDLLTPDLSARLLANARAHHHAMQGGNAEGDPAPVVKFFNPVGAATWLATELDHDGDTLFGLADLGFGCPEMGSFSLSEIATLRLPLGQSIERDLSFTTAVPLSVWADTARLAGSITRAGAILLPVEAHRRTHAATTSDISDGASPSGRSPLPPSVPDVG